MKGNPSTALGESRSATCSLRDESDLVSLRRRVRAASAEAGLDDSRIRRLAASVYEVGRRLSALGIAAEAELGLADGPRLRVVFRIRRRAHSDVSKARNSVASLRTMIEGLTVTHSQTEVSISLDTPCHPGSRLPPTRGALPAQTGALVADDPGPHPHTPQKSFRQLRRAYREMLEELQETNRGVVALYGELNDQAHLLRDAEDRLRLLLDSVQDYAICMLSRTGHVASWNSGAQRLFGYDADDILGRSFLTFYTGADRAAKLPAAQLLAAERTGRLETEGPRVRRGGLTFEAHMILTAVRDTARDLRSFSLVVRDISERKRLEEDLRRRADELAAANRAKEDFLATLSHELRTPLNAMVGWARLLRTGKLDAAGAARAVEAVERNAHIQEQLIADILDVSRIVTGKLRLNLRSIDLVQVVEAAIDSVRPAAEAKGVSLLAVTGTASTVLGDPDRLQQVFWNLLVNAIKFTAFGGRVTVSLKRDETDALLTVSDTGEGIDPELLPFIFDRFRQGDASATRSHGGLGLGLSIVRHIVELHGGTVQAHSQGFGRGATFSVHLPLRAIRHAAGSRADAARPLEGLKVLVVDAEPDAREVVSMALRQIGAMTRAAGSVREALRLLAAFHPDVLISDIRMPGEDGYALIRHVRGLASPTGRQLPAIALSPLVHADDRRRALAEGYQRFVVKPVEVDELAGTIRALVPASRKHRRRP